MEKQASKGQREDGGSIFEMVGDTRTRCKGNSDVASLKANTRIVFTQINLHHCKVATAVLARSITEMHTNIAIIQEPWIDDKGRIAGLGGCGKIGSATGGPVPACILVKGLEAEAVPKHYKKDLVAARIRFKEEGGIHREILVRAAYFTYDYLEDPPPDGVKALIKECEEKGIQLLLGCDANAY